MENTTFNLEIITPDTSEKLVVQWVEIESPTGSFLVGHNHSSLISIIKKKSSFTYKTDEGKEFVRDAPGGSFRVQNNEAIILLEQ